MATKTKAMSAVHVKTERIPLADISVEEDSGWRPVDAQHMADLRAVVLNGDYGNTTLAKPSVLLDQSDKVRSLHVPPPVQE